MSQKIAHTQQDQTGVWNHVSDLHIAFDDGSDAGSGKIFANGYQQIPVRITVTPCDAKNHAITAAQCPDIRSQVLAALSIQDASGPRALPYVSDLDSDGGCGGNNWCYTQTPNSFNGGGIQMLAARADEQDARLQFVFYVMCPAGRPRFAINLLASIQMPNGQTTNTSGGSGNMPYESVHISSLPQLRYNESNTLLSNQVVHTGEGNGAGLLSQAVNYEFSCNEQGFYFAQIKLSRETGPQPYYHVFDQDSAYHNEGENFVRYRHFSMAYAWSEKDGARQNVFGLRPALNGKPETWNIPIQGQGNSQVFTVVQYDSTLSSGPGFGYPGAPVNDQASPPVGGTPVYLTVWDQYGNSADFYPTTDGLLGEFTLKVGQGTQADLPLDVQYEVPGRTLEQRAVQGFDATNWGPVVGISKLQVQFGDSPYARDGALYANSRNQIYVQVAVQAVSKGNHPIINPSAAVQDSIFSSLYLVERTRLSALNWNQNSGWNYTDQRNAFVTTPSSAGGAVQRVQVSHAGRTVGDDGTIYFGYYVMCAFGEPTTSLGLAAQVVNVPDGYGNTKSFDCAGHTGGIEASVLSLRTSPPRNFSQAELQTVPRRVVDDFQPSGRSSHCYADLHTFTLPEWCVPYRWDWSNGTNSQACYGNYYRAGQDAKWCIYGSVFPPANGSNGTHSQSYSRYLGDSLYYAYGGFLGSNYDDKKWFTVTAQSNQIIVSKVIGNGFSFINEDWNGPNSDIYIDVTDSFGTVHRLRFGTINTTDYGTGPQLSSDLVRP